MHNAEHWRRRADEMRRIADGLGILSVRRHRYFVLQTNSIDWPRKSKNDYRQNKAPTTSAGGAKSDPYNDNAPSCRRWAQRARWSAVPSFLQLSFAHDQVGIGALLPDAIFKFAILFRK